MPEKSVIIVAGGSGTRMELAVPKQFLMMAGKPILIHTIEAFLNYDPAIRLILVLPKDHLETWEDIQIEYLSNKEVTVVAGGNSRFQSVKAGLSVVTTGLVAIHDGVRPLIPEEVIAASFDAAEKTGSGVAMVKVKDSIRKRDASGSTQARDRSRYLAVQTPQTFRADLIKKAFEQEESDWFTDDATVYECSGQKVTLVNGDYRNFKITTLEDLLIAEALLK